MGIQRVIYIYQRDDGFTFHGLQRHDKEALTAFSMSTISAQFLLKRVAYLQSNYYGMYSLALISAKDISKVMPARRASEYMGYAADSFEAIADEPLSSNIMDIRTHLQGIINRAKNAALILDKSMTEEDIAPFLMGYDPKFSPETLSREADVSPSRLGSPQHVAAE